MPITSCAEKYLPTSIQEVVFNNPNTEHFMLAYESRDLRCPHLMLYGTNGNGKTTVANLLAKSLSSGGGLWLRDTVEEFVKRADIRQYLHNTVLTYGEPNDRAVVVFNELEQFSRNLARLWAIMDANEDKLLVIITTNEPAKFQNAIKSRCDKYEFSRITPVHFASRAQQILEQEGLHLSVKDVSAYLQKYTGAHSDVRDYLRTLDKMLSLYRGGRLEPINASAVRPTLTVVS
jgi:replication-associated recombination protein RarA